MEGKSNFKKVISLLGETCLFYIERSIDRDIVVYNATRNGNILVHPFVETYWSDWSNLKKHEEVSDKAKELFFGLKYRKHEGKHEIAINSLPKKKITLHLRKSGRVVAKTIINNKEAKIMKIFIDMTKNSFGIPEVDCLIVYGMHKNQIVSEKIIITDEIKNRFNVSAFFEMAAGF